MRADGVPGGSHLLEDAGLVGRMQTDRKEDRPRAVRSERGKHGLSVLRPGPIVEGQHLPGIFPAVRLILSSSSGWNAARLPRWRSIHERCSRTCWPPPAHHSRHQAIGEGVYLVWHPRAIAPTRYGVRRAAMKPARPASIASVFRPGPVDRRSRTIAACRRGRSRSRRISDNRHRSRRG